MSESILESLASKYPMLEQAWVPKPFRSDLEWAVAKALVRSPELQRNIPEEEVDINMDFQTTQSRFDDDKVNALVQNGAIDGGLAFRTKSGVIFLWDGHHRNIAAQRLGCTRRRMRVFDLTHDSILDSEAKEGMSLKDWASCLGVRVSSILRAMDSDDHRRYEYQDHHEG